MGKKTNSLACVSAGITTHNGMICQFTSVASIFQFRKKFETMEMRPEFLMQKQMCRKWPPRCPMCSCSPKTGHKKNPIPFSGSICHGVILFRFPMHIVFSVAREKEKKNKRFRIHTLSAHSTNIYFASVESPNLNNNIITHNTPKYTKISTPHRCALCASTQFKYSFSQNIGNLFIYHFNP